MSEFATLEERIAQLEQLQRESLAATKVVLERTHLRQYRGILLVLGALLVGLAGGAWLASKAGGQAEAIEAAERQIVQRLDAFGRDTLPELVQALCGSEQIAAARRDAEEAATRALQNADATEVLVSRLEGELREAQSRIDELGARLKAFDEKAEFRVGKLIAREVLVDTRLEAGEVALKEGRARLYTQTNVRLDGHKEEVALLQLFGSQTDQPDTNAVASLSATRLTTGEQSARLDLRTHERIGPRARIALNAVHGAPQDPSSYARCEMEDQDHAIRFGADSPELLKLNP